MRAPGLSVCAFLAAAFAARADCRPPSLSIERSSASPRQGAIVAVVVTSDVPLARATLFDGGRDVAMEVSPDGTVLRALVGVDFESMTGPRRVRVEAEGLCGDVHRSSAELRVVSGKFPSQKLAVAPAYVEVPAEELGRVARDKAEVGRVWAAPDSARQWSTAFRLPVEAPLRDNFGSRRVFNGKPRSPHEGVDLAAAAGAPVAAPAPAVVALADNLYFSGGTVILDHGGGLFTMYFHLSRIDVRPGEVLATGRPIGAVGATGRATGPHLHWGARLHHARVNPLDLLELPSWSPPREK